MMERAPQPVREMLALLRESGHTPYLVGGCVRDLLRGAEPDDYDMTSDARPEEVMAIFGADAHPTGLRHGTVTLVRGGLAVEHTTERCDGAYRDSRHPESVRFTSSIEEDLARRDFTVNAIALSADGRLVDPFGGQADLRAGVLRCVGDPARRFAEDALRILRLLRFASVLGFSVEENTARAAWERRDGLRAIAHERVYAELNKLLCGEHAAAVLLEYPDILGVVLPDILPCVGFDQRTPHQCYDVWAVQEAGALLAYANTRTITAAETGCVPVVRLVDFIGDDAVLPRIGGALDKLLHDAGAEYLDCYNAGIPAAVWAAAGLTERREDDGVIIPNYLTPPLRQNTEYYYFTNQPDGFVLFKADGDQDRPNLPCD